MSPTGKIGVKDYIKNVIITTVPIEFFVYQNEFVVNHRKLQSFEFNLQSI